MRLDGFGIMVDDMPTMVLFFYSTENLFEDIENKDFLTKLFDVMYPKLPELKKRGL